MAQQDIGRAVMFTMLSCLQAQHDKFGPEAVAREIALPPDLRDDLVVYLSKGDASVATDFGTIVLTVREG